LRDVAAHHRNPHAVTTGGPISLNGNASPAGVVDPDATRLPGGRIRLAYLGGFGAPNSASARAMCLADSDDGVAFTVVGPAYDIPAEDTLTNPSLARLTDGSWLMAMSRGQQTVMARSGDGLRFGVYDTLVAPGTLGARIICDPSWVPDAGLFIFKIAQQADRPAPPSAPPAGAGAAGRDRTPPRADQTQSAPRAVSVRIPLRPVHRTPVLRRRPARRSPKHSRRRFFPGWSSLARRTAFSFRPLISAGACRAKRVSITAQCGFVLTNCGARRRSRSGPIS
jgi:hypothetical protein